VPASVASTEAADKRETGLAIVREICSLRMVDGNWTLCTDAVYWSRELIWRRNLVAARDVSGASSVMRAGIVLISFLPFLYYATKDTLFHFTGRRVTLAEHGLHLAVGLSLAMVLTNAVLGKSPAMLVGLVLFAVAGAIDEYVWHRGIPETESDLHAKEHLALLIFVVVTLTVNWLESYDWQISRALDSLRAHASPKSAHVAQLSLFGVFEPPTWRAVVLIAFFLPYTFFGLNDNLHHARHRHVSWAERILHATIVLALFTVVPHAIFGSRAIMVVGLLLFVFARALDEWVFHRRLMDGEADMHAKTHLAFLIFVVAGMAIDSMTHRTWI